MSSNVDLNSGICQITDCLYNSAFSLFGKTYTTNNHNAGKVKFKSPWFNQECYTARKQCNAANKVYRKNNSLYNGDVLLASRRNYSLIKRRARAQYRLSERSKFTYLAKQNSKSFWAEINKRKKKKHVKSNITNDEYFEYFRDIFSNDDIFSSVNIESELRNKEYTINSVDQLDREFTVEEILKAISSLRDI